MTFAKALIEGHRLFEVLLEGIRQSLTTSLNKQGLPSLVLLRDVIEHLGYRLRGLTPRPRLPQLHWHLYVLVARPVQVFPVNWLRDILKPRSRHHHAPLFSRLHRHLYVLVARPVQVFPVNWLRDILKPRSRHHH